MQDSKTSWIFFILSEERNEKEKPRPGSQRASHTICCSLIGRHPCALFPHFLGKGVGSGSPLFSFPNLMPAQCWGHRWKWMAPTSYRSSVAAEITVVCGPWWFMVVVSSSAHGSLPALTTDWGRHRSIGDLATSLCFNCKKRYGYFFDIAFSPSGVASNKQYFIGGGGKAGRH